MACAERGIPQGHKHADDDRATDDGRGKLLGSTRHAEHNDRQHVASIQRIPENVAEAMEVLDQPIPESFAVDGVEEYQQPRCPKCQSLDVTFQNLNKPIAYGSAYLNVPIPIKNKAWKCSSCGCEWEETESSEEDKN